MPRPRLRRGRRRKRKQGVNLRRHTQLRVKQLGVPVSDRFHKREEVDYVQRVECRLAESVPRVFEGPLELSVVTGSYGRLALLQRMVASVREGLRPDVSYEIIVVDGGSTDGTQDWCDQQPDVELLAGDLNGAVPNFNRGFVQARGRYVCMANDDIEFAGDSLQLALDFVGNHHRCGAACVSQARPPTARPWVSLMAVDLNGAARQWPMAQVAIVPKWLGDHLGWWGNITSHYHGDQLLSRRIWEEGFTCSIVPDAWVRDYAPSDELRKRNNGLGRGVKDARIYMNMHPMGPKIGSAPTIQPPSDISGGTRPDVDIVMGTCNRIGLLQNCIEGARRAADGLEHRFIIVDGGSIDGTLEWLREQDDVLLIETGVLDGAVRAFNRGFARATADYVVHINDDMAIVSGALGQAIDHLERQPDVGQLAFPTAVGNSSEFRNHDCWGHTFANFGLLPRWLGNYVGWWGTWTHKYFGDVHCSLRIWELGYSVEVFPQIKCRDFLPADDLRGEGDAQCKRDSNEFDTNWQTRKVVKGSPPIVLIPDAPLVRRAEFE